MLVTVLVGQALAAALHGAWRPSLGLLAVVVAVVAGVDDRRRRATTVGTAEVALVQGGGEQGTRQSDTGVVEVFERHVDATALVERARRPRGVARGRDRHRPARSSTTPGPSRRPIWRSGLDAPMIVGTVEDAGPEHFKNAAVLFDADGDYVASATTRCTACPFGEYVPFRSLLETVAGDALPDRDAVIGDLPDHLDVPGPVGRVVTPISWEIFFADRTREGVEDGARLVLNPTNGSSFTGTIVQTQQVASSRMRAIETGRWVAQVAPTGFTAVIDEQGHVLERTAISEQRVLQREVTLREGLTIYTRLGNGPGLALAALCIAGGWAVQRRRPA